MRKPAPKNIIAGCVVVLLLFLAVAAVWALSNRSPSPAGTTLPDTLQVEALKAKAADPLALRETLRSAELTNEQRQELARNMREVMRSHMQTRVNEYLTAAGEDKRAVLDRHIDEMQRHMREWERERDGVRRGPPQPPPEDMRRRFRQSTREERKAHSESRNPDEMAQHMAYFAALRKRMDERGLKMPMGPPRGGPRHRP